MNTREKGNKGEDVACTYLRNRGFVIVARNYSRKWGEIDIIAKKDTVRHFFEVKSVASPYSEQADIHKPEDNVHGLKVKHIRRMIETYFEEQDGRIDLEFQFHVLSVYMNGTTRRAHVEWLKNVIL